MTPSHALTNLHGHLAEQGIRTVGMDFGHRDGILFPGDGTWSDTRAACSGGLPAVFAAAGPCTRSTPPPTRMALPAGSPMLASGGPVPCHIRGSPVIAAAVAASRTVNMMAGARSRRARK